MRTRFYTGQIITVRQGSTFEQFAKYRKYRVEAVDQGGRISQRKLLESHPDDTDVVVGKVYSNWNSLESQLNLYEVVEDIPFKVGDIIAHSELYTTGYTEKRKFEIIEIDSATSVITHIKIVDCGPNDLILGTIYPIGHGVKLETQVECWKVINSDKKYRRIVLGKNKKHKLTKVFT